MAFAGGYPNSGSAGGSVDPDTVSNTLSVADQAARYALVEGTGEGEIQADDLVRQVDTGIVYAFNGGDPSQASGWDQVTGVRPVSLGGTGSATASGARTNLDVPSNSDLTTGLAGKASLTSGKVGLSIGGTGVDLSASGGSTHLLAQAADHTISARALVAGDLPNHSASLITSGTLGLARGGLNQDLSTAAGIKAAMDSLGAQRALVKKRIMLWEPPSSATTVPGVLGFPALTTGGTVTARTPSTTKPERRLGFVSASSTGALAYLYSAAAVLCPGIYVSPSLLGGFRWACTFRVSDASLVSGARMFVGLDVARAFAAPTNADPAAGTGQIGIAQVASSGNFHIVRGGQAAQTAVDTGIAVGTSTLYTVLITSAPIAGSTSTTAVEFVVSLIAGYGDGATVYSQTFTETATECPHPTDLGALLVGAVIWRCNNSSSSPVAVDVCRIYVEELL